MRSKRQNGFVLWIVIIALALTAIIMAVLANHLKNLGNETTIQRLKVYNDNITSSAMAWTTLNAQNLAEKSPGQTIDLDVADLQINGGKAELTVTAIDENEIKLDITTECSRGRLNIKRTRSKTIKIPTSKTETQGT